jgi:hypothetical protein
LPLPYRLDIIFDLKAALFCKELGVVATVSYVIYAVLLSKDSTVARRRRQLIYGRVLGN